MAALIRQANSGYELANMPKIKTKDVRWKRRERKQNNNNKQTNTFWKERGGRKCQRATWQRLDTRNPCTWYNPLSTDNNTAGQQTLTNYPTQRLSGLVKHRDYPPHSYIVNERYNSRNKRASKEGEKKTVNGKNRSLAQPQTLTQGGHEIASLLNQNEQNFFIFTYGETNTDKLGK